MKKIFSLAVILSIIVTSMPLIKAEETSKIYYTDFIQQIIKEKEENKYQKDINVQAIPSYAVESAVADPEFNKQINLKKINIEGAWNQTAYNYNPKIAIIDSGLNLYNDIEGSNIINGCSIINGTTTGTYNDDSFQGTRIASIIAAKKNSVGIAGISPNAKIIPIKVAQSNGVNSSTDTIKAIEWAIDKGADIIYLNNTEDSYNENLQKAIIAAYNENILVVAPTGDDGDLSKINYPAAYDRVLSVGATDNTDKILATSNKGMEIEIMAPGKDIYLPETVTTYKSYTSTAYAAATVVGVASLIKSTKPQLSNIQIEQLLLTSAYDLTSIKGWDWDSGYGRIDANSAMSLAKNISWDGNDSLAKAKSITFNQSQEGSLYPARDIDLYKFSVSKPGKVVVEATVPSGSDIMLMILDSNGYIYDIKDNGLEGENEFLQTELIESGTYYIQVFDYYGDYNKSSNYQISIINPINKGNSIRFAGKDKWVTSSMISKNGWNNSENLVLAYGNKYHDALSGAPFAYSLDAPMLLTDKSKVPTDIMNEINRIKPKNIYVLGGYLVVSDSLINQLKAKGYNVQRVWGDTKYDTAVECGEELRSKYMSDTAVVAYGNNYPDALAISGIAAENNWPILFTDTKTLNSSTQKALKDWNIKKVKIVGGNLVISQNVENQIKAMGISVERVAGADKFETAILIAKRFKPNAQGLIVTTGNNYPDALSGGPLAGKYGYPLILVDKENASTEILNYVVDSQANRAIFLGGTLAIKDKIMQQITNKLSK